MSSLLPGIWIRNNYPDNVKWSELGKLHTLNWSVDKPFSCRPRRRLLDCKWKFIGHDPRRVVILNHRLYTSSPERLREKLGLSARSPNGTEDCSRASRSWITNNYVRDTFTPGHKKHVFCALRFHFIIRLRFLFSRKWRLFVRTQRSTDTGWNSRRLTENFTPFTKLTSGHLEYYKAKCDLGLSSIHFQYNNKVWGTLCPVVFLSMTFFFSALPSLAKHRINRKKSWETDAPYIPLIFVKGSPAWLSASPKPLASV